MSASFGQLEVYVGSHAEGCGKPTVCPSSCPMPPTQRHVIGGSAESLGHTGTVESPAKPRRSLAGKPANVDSAPVMLPQAGCASRYTSHTLFGSPDAAPAYAAAS